MALTSTQQNKVIQLLGYGGKILQAGSVIYNKILNDRLTNLPTDTETVVVSYLTQIASVETLIAQAYSRLSAEKVGDITINKNELQDLRKERKKLSREMAALLDIPYQGTSSNISVGV